MGSVATGTPSSMMALMVWRRTASDARSKPMARTLGPNGSMNVTGMYHSREAAGTSSRVAGSTSMSGDQPGCHRAYWERLNPRSGSSCARSASNSGRVALRTKVLNDRPCGAHRARVHVQAHTKRL